MTDTPTQELSYHEKFAAAEPTLAQQQRIGMQAVQRMLATEALRVEKEMKGVFINNIFKKLNLDRFC